MQQHLTDTSPLMEQQQNAVEMQQKNRTSMRRQMGAYRSYQELWNAMDSYGMLWPPCSFQMLTYARVEQHKMKNIKKHEIYVCIMNAFDIIRSFVLNNAPKKTNGFI